MILTVEVGRTQDGSRGVTRDGVRQVIWEWIGRQYGLHGGLCVCDVFQHANEVIVPSTAESHVTIYLQHVVLIAVQRLTQMTGKAWARRLFVVHVQDTNVLVSLCLCVCLCVCCYWWRLPVPLAITIHTHTLIRRHTVQARMSVEAQIHIRIVIALEHNPYIHTLGVRGGSEQIPHCLL
jgi:hypothetical protein